MSGHSSSSTFHDFQEFISSNYQKIRNSKFQKFKNWKAKVSKISKFLSFRILQKMRSHFVQGCSLIFSWFFQVFWSNKMKKYGLPEPKIMKCWQVDLFLLTVDEKKLDFSPSCQTHKILISWHKTSKT